MNDELIAAFETFCEDYHIKNADDLKGMASMFEMYTLQGIPDGRGGYIGVDENRWCTSCSMRVDKESLVDYKKSKSFPFLGDL